MDFPIGKFIQKLPKDTSSIWSRSTASTTTSHSAVQMPMGSHHLGALLGVLPRRFWLVEWSSRDAGGKKTRYMTSSGNEHTTISSTTTTTTCHGRCFQRRVEQQQNVCAPASSDSAFTLSFGWDETKQAAARPRQLHEEVTTMRLNDGPVEGSDQDPTEGSLGFRFGTHSLSSCLFWKGSTVVQLV